MALPTARARSCGGTKTEFARFSSRTAGRAAALNAGIREARGEILCLLDADDTWFPGKIASVVEKYRQGPWGPVSHDLLMRGDRGIRVPAAAWSACTGVRLREGRVFTELVRERFAWAFSPTSGLCYRRRSPGASARSRSGTGATRRILRSPSAAYLAPVGAIGEPLGHYRVHGRNDLGFESFGPERKRVWRLWHLPRRENSFASSSRSAATALSSSCAATIVIYATGV